MDAFATDNLFLLEFLVDFVKLDYGIQQDLFSMSGETCVGFQFLDNAPLYVSEEDFAPGHKNIGDPCASINKNTIKNGKSCIFSLSPVQAENGRYEFNIYLEVFKRLKPGTLPDKISLGETLVSIVNLFNDLVDAVQKSNIDTPVTKTLKDTYNIYNPSGELAGNVGIYLRMSCFGKLIVTQFQMNLQDKSVEFKANEGHYLFKYNKKDGGCPETCGQQVVQSCYPPCKKESSYDDFGASPANSQYYAPQQQGSTYSNNPGCPFNSPPACPTPEPLQCPYSPKCPYSSTTPSLCPVPPCQQTNQSCMCCQPCSPPPCANPCQLPPCINPCQLPPCLNPTQPPSCPNPYQPPPCLNPCQQYQLQMQQDAALPPCNECMPPPPPPSACECDPEADFEEIGATMGGNSLLIRVHKDKQKIEQVENADDTTCCCVNANNNQSPKTNGLNSNQTKNNPNSGNSPFCFKIGGKGSQNVCVQPPTVENPCGTKVTQLNDPNKEQFILRIGKKSEGINKKNNLELELCTPKGKDLKPIPKLESRDTQCDPTEDDSKKKKGKGKKEKGNKKKKGKK